MLASVLSHGEKRKAHNKLLITTACILPIMHAMRNYASGYSFIVPGPKSNSTISIRNLIDFNAVSYLYENILCSSGQHVLVRFVPFLL